MTGRDEREALVKRHIESKLDYKPPYMKEFYTSMNDVLPLTQATYMQVIFNFLDYIWEEWDVCPWKLEDLEVIDSTDLQEWLFLMDAKDATKNKVYFALKKFFSFMEENDYLSKDPMRKVKKPKSPKIEDAVSLTEEEIKIVFENIKHPEQTDTGDIGEAKMECRKKFINRNLAIFSLTLTNGLRCSSLVDMNLEDINFEDGTIRIVQKGDKYHIAYLSDNTKQYLKDWLEDRKLLLIEKEACDDALFLGAKGHRINQAEINKLLKWATFNIDKNITPHKLRSTCATTVYNKTKDLNLAARILGHADVNTTRRYIGVDSDQEKQAIQILDKIFG